MDSASGRVLCGGGAIRLSALGLMGYDETELQFSIGTNGKIMCGGGNVILDADGLTVDSSCSIVGGVFKTSSNVGESGGPAGVRMDANGIAGYISGTVKAIYINAVDGAIWLGNGMGRVVLNADGIYGYDSSTTTSEHLQFYLDSNTGKGIFGNGTASIGKTGISFTDDVGVITFADGGTSLGVIAATKFDAFYIDAINGDLRLSTGASGGEGGDIHLFPESGKVYCRNLYVEGAETRYIGESTHRWNKGYFETLNCRYLEVELSCGYSLQPKQSNLNLGGAIPWENLYVNNLVIHHSIYSNLIPVTSEGVLSPLDLGDGDHYWNSSRIYQMYTGYINSTGDIIADQAGCDCKFYSIRWYTHPAWDEYDDLEIIKAMKPDKKNPKEMDRNTIHPDLFARKKVYEKQLNGKIKATVIDEPDENQFMDLGNNIGLIYGGLRKIIEKIEILEEENMKLREEFDEYKKNIIKK
jgi:hypothetical protein